METGFLPPGFRFHPTDSELLQYYLKRKVTGLHIPELDLYKFCPWDLPEKSQFQSKNHEWYFFCPKNRKHFFGLRINRTNEVGYWKVSGRDRPIYHNSQILGMKKILVFYLGRAPRGERTNWVMHEYRLQDGDGAMELMQDSYVLCRVFQKSGLGRRNGEEILAGEDMNCKDDVAANGLELTPTSQIIFDEFHNNSSIKSSIQMGSGIKSNQSTPDSVISSIVTSDDEKYNFPAIQLHSDQNNPIEVQNFNDRNAVEAVLNSNDFDFYEDLEGIMSQAGLNMGDEYKQLFVGSFSNEIDDLIGYDGGLNFLDNSLVGLKGEALFDQEESYWLHEMFNIFPEENVAGYETVGFETMKESGNSSAKETGNEEMKQASVLESFVVSIPARSASAIELPSQWNASSKGKFVKKTNRRNCEGQRRRSGGGFSQFGFVCGLALIGMVFLVVAGKIGFFLWDFILN